VGFLERIYAWFFDDTKTCAEGKKPWAKGKGRTRPRVPWGEEGEKFFIARKWSSFEQLGKRMRPNKRRGQEITGNASEKERRKHWRL